MLKIQILNKISEKGLEKFPKDEYEMASEIVNPDAILLRSFNLHDMDIPASVKAVARAGAGVNNIPVDRCKERGIVVFNTPGANANAVKELVIAGLIISSRRIFRSMVWTKELVGEGTEVPKLIEKGKKQFAGPEIKGKRLGVIGLGAIGVMVANDALALGMEVSGYDPYISIEAAWGLSRSVKREVSLEKLISRSDYLTIHVPVNDSTKGMLNSKRFDYMKKGTRLLNFSRGELVNNEDLIEALNNDTLSFYITDFPNEELLKTDKVMSFPHLGASTYESEENCAVMAVDQLHNYLENGNIKNSVNFPDSTMERSQGTTRLVIANRNIPSMVGQITSVLAEREINIAEMLNKSREDYAYNIIDTDSDVTDTLLDKIRAIDGVVMVRSLEK
jgi:D-3-phosphoglycerate dehydrogenase